MIKQEKQIKELEKEFDSLSSSFNGVRTRKAGVDYTEWKILQSKLKGLKQGHSNAQEEILEFLIDCINKTDSVRKKLKKKVAEIRNSQIQTKESK